VIKPLNANIYELNFSPFAQNGRARLEIGITDLKARDLWNSNFRNLVTKPRIWKGKKRTSTLQHKWSEIGNLKK
jgi:hypothetical protein